jgi:hypothetical protein
MPITNEIIAAIDAEFEVRRRLTEREEVEMQRQRELLETQLQLVTAVQADLDILRGYAGNADSASTDIPTSGSGHDRDTTGGQ